MGYPILIFAMCFFGALLKDPLTGSLRAALLAVVIGCCDFPAMVTVTLRGVGGRGGGGKV